MQNAARIEDGCDLENEVDQTIAECGVDARETVKALLVANAHLEVARERVIGLLSRGFVRGQLENVGHNGQR